MTFPTPFLEPSQPNFRTPWSPLFGCYSFDRLPRTLVLIVQLEFIGGVLFLKICGGIESGRKTYCRMADVAFHAILSGQWWQWGASKRVCGRELAKNKTGTPVARDHVRSLSLSKARRIVCTKNDSKRKGSATCRGHENWVQWNSPAQRTIAREKAMSHKYR